MRGVAVLVAGLLLAGCTGTRAEPVAQGSSPPSTVAPVPGISGEVVRLRTDEALGGQVQVRLTDTGDRSFTVTAVALRSPAFADQPLAVQTAAYRPGQVIDLPVPFGPVDCAVDVVPVTAEVVLTWADGRAETVAVPLAGDALQTVRTEECAVARVLAQVTIAVRGFGDAGADVTGSVVVTRVAGSSDDVRLLSLGRSVLMAPVAEGLPRTVPVGQPAVVVPIRIGMASCDPHILAETKKPFVFPLLVEVAGRSAAVDLPLDAGQRGQLQALVDRVCG